MNLRTPLRKMSDVIGDIQSGKFLLDMSKSGMSTTNYNQTGEEVLQEEEAKEGFCESKNAEAGATDEVQASVEECQVLETSDTEGESSLEDFIVGPSTPTVESPTYTPTQTDDEEGGMQVNTDKAEDETESSSSESEADESSESVEEEERCSKKPRLEKRADYWMKTTSKVIHA